MKGPEVEGDVTGFEGASRLRGARRSLRLAILLSGLVGLAGCYQTTGDFGRPTQGVWENSILPFTGVISSRTRGEHGSWYQFTEDEKELRARAWRFLNPDQDAPVFTHYQDALAYHKILPPRSFDVTLYHRTVMGGPYLGGIVGDSPTVRAMVGTGYGGGTFRSLVSRYNRVRDSITQDHQLVPHFRLIAAQVVEADRVRARALEHVGHLTQEHRDEAVHRICENALLINRVNWAFHDRAAMYRYSLEHLLVEGPEREAIPSERTLMAFEKDIAAFQKVTLMPPGCGSVEETAVPPPMQPMPLVRKY